MTDGMARYEKLVQVGARLLYRAYPVGGLDWEEVTDEVRQDYEFAVSQAIRTIRSLRSA